MAFCSLCFVKILVFGFRPTQVIQDGHFEILDLIISAKIFFPNKATFTGSRWTYLGEAPFNPLQHPNWSLCFYSCLLHKSLPHRPSEWTLAYKAPQAQLLFSSLTSTTCPCLLCSSHMGLLSVPQHSMLLSTWDLCTYWSLCLESSWMSLQCWTLLSLKGTLLKMFQITQSTYPLPLHTTFGLHLGLSFVS